MVIYRKTPLAEDFRNIRINIGAHCRNRGLEVSEIALVEKRNLMKYSRKHQLVR
jgi:hypothetical protein